MKTIRNFLCWIFLLLAGNTAMSQDIHFSQFFEAPLLRNPALAGIYTGDIRVQAVYRDQWNSVTDAYRTGSLNAEFRMPIGRGDDFITTGMELLVDRAGTIGWTSTHVMPVINYHKSVSADHNQYLSLGFMGGWVHRYFDRSKITTNTQYDGGGDGETMAQTSYSYLDGGVGLSFNSTLNDNPENNFYIGAAYHHFNRPSYSFYRNPAIELYPKWVFSGGVRFGVNDYSYVTIMADHSRQGGFKETVAGGMYGLKIGVDPDNPDYTVHGGFFMRANDAVIPVIKIDYSPFSVALSYDINISKLKPSSYGRGGVELSITYIGFSNRMSRSAQNSTRCPKF